MVTHGNTGVQMEQNQCEIISAGKEIVSNLSPLHFNRSVSTTLQKMISATVSPPAVRQNAKHICTSPLIMKSVGDASKEGGEHIYKVSTQSTSGIESSDFSKQVGHQLFELDVTCVQNFPNQMEMLPMVREMDNYSSNEVLIQPTEKSAFTATLKPPVIPQSIDIDGEPGQLCSDQLEVFSESIVNFSNISSHDMNHKMDKTILPKAQVTPAKLII